MQFGINNIPFQLAQCSTLLLVISQVPLRCFELIAHLMEGLCIHLQLNESHFTGNALSNQSCIRDA